MSKKWKNKLKKKQKSELMRQAMSTAAANSEVVDIATSSGAVSPITSDREPDQVLESLGKKTKIQPQKDNFLPEAARVKSDVRKIIYITILILVLLCTATIADRKTGWILEAANSIFRGLQI